MVFSVPMLTLPHPTFLAWSGFCRTNYIGAIREKLKLLILYIDGYETRKSLDYPIDQNFLIDTVLCQVNGVHIRIPDSKLSFLYLSTGFWSKKTVTFHTTLLPPSQEKMMEAA